MQRLFALWELLHACRANFNLAVQKRGDYKQDNARQGKAWRTHCVCCVVCRDLYLCALGVEDVWEVSWAGQGAGAQGELCSRPREQRGALTVCTAYDK